MYVDELMMRISNVVTLREKNVTNVDFIVYIRSDFSNNNNNNNSSNSNNNTSYYVNDRKIDL